MSGTTNPLGAGLPSLSDLISQSPLGRLYALLFGGGGNMLAGGLGGSPTGYVRGVDGRIYPNMPATGSDGRGYVNPPGFDMQAQQRVLQSMPAGGIGKPQTDYLYIPSGTASVRYQADPYWDSVHAYAAAHPLAAPSVSTMTPAQAAAYWANFNRQFNQAYAGQPAGTPIVRTGDTSDLYAKAVEDTNRFIDPRLAAMR